MMLSYKASFNTALATMSRSLANPFLEPKWYTKPWYLYPWLWVCCFRGFKDIHLPTTKGITQPSPLITAIKLTSLSFQIISATWQLSICQTVKLSCRVAAYQRNRDAGSLKQHAADKARRMQHSSRKLLIADGLCPFFWIQILDSLGEKTIEQKTEGMVSREQERFCLLPNVSFFNGCTAWFKNPSIWTTV